MPRIKYSPKQEVTTPRIDIPPREYQREAVSAFRSWFYEPERPEALISLACGMGKTLTAGYCIVDLLKVNAAAQVLWVIDRQELVEQTKKALEHDLHIPIGIEMGGKHAYAESIVVASMQSLHENRLAEFSSRFKPELVVFDEAHLGHGGLRASIMATTGKHHAKFLNMTGTPFMGTVFAPINLGEVLVSRSMDYGIKHGYIVPPVLVDQIRVDLSLASVSNGDYTEKSLTKLLCKENVLKRTASLISENMAGQKTLIAAASREHGQALAGALYKLGIKVPQIYYDTPKDSRKQILEDFQSGKTNVLINNLILVKGYNEPSITQMFNLRPTKLSDLTIQILSRGVRLDRNNDKKTHCRIFDIQNIADIDPKNAIHVPFEAQDREGVRQMVPISKAAFLVSYFFNKEQLQTDPIQAVKQKGELTDPTKLYNTLNFGAQATTPDAIATKKLLAQALMPPQSNETDNSINQLLTAARCPTLDHFMQRMDEAGLYYSPNGQVPIDQPEQLQSLISKWETEVISLKRDYDMKEFLRETTLEGILTNKIKTSDVFKERHNRTVRWYRPWQPTTTPFWIKPIDAERTAIRIESKTMDYMVLNNKEGTIRTMLQTDWADIREASQKDEATVMLAQADIEEYNMPMAAVGSIISKMDKNAIVLHKSLEKEIQQVHAYVQDFMQKQIQLAEISF